MKQRILATAVALIMATSAAPGMAEEGVPPETDEPTYGYSAENHVLAWGPDTDCSGVTDVELSIDESGRVTTITGTDEGAEEPDELDGCTLILVEGPNGQVNHGTVVSSFVKALKEMELEGPKGHYVREITKSTLGKGDQQVKAGDESDEDGETATAEGDKTSRGKGKGKGKANGHRGR